MSRQSKANLRKRGTAIKATICIGKNGISESLVNEIKEQIEKHKIVKVKLFKTSGLEKSDAAERIMKLTGAALLEVRGNTILLCDSTLLAKED